MGRRIRIAAFPHFQDRSVFGRLREWPTPGLPFGSILLFIFQRKTTTWAYDILFKLIIYILSSNLLLLYKKGFVLFAFIFQRLSLWSTFFELMIYTPLHSAEWRCLFLMIYIFEFVIYIIFAILFQFSLSLLFLSSSFRFFVSAL